MTHDVPLALLQTHLSFHSRVAHLALLLAALGMGTVVAALLITEPALPASAVIAFLLMLVIALAWSGYAAWVLTARDTLLAPHRVVAARIAVSATGIFTLGGGLLGLASGLAAPWAAAGFGLPLLALAVFLLARAQENHRQLLQRRAELEAALRA